MSRKKTKNGTMPDATGAERRSSLLTEGQKIVNWSKGRASL
jgi:hypothetical protein